MFRRPFWLALVALPLVAGKNRPSPGDIAKNFAPPVAGSDLIVRSTFDAEPSAIIGRFVDAADAAPDDGQALETRCSPFIVPEVVQAGGTQDLLIRADASVAASLGVPPLMAVTVGGHKEQTLRVKYKLTEKMRYTIPDPAGFQSCCKAAPGQCGERFISEVVRGDGVLMYALGKEGGVNMSGVGSGVAGTLEVHGGYVWQQATTLDGMYFAFKTAPSGIDAAAGPTLASGPCGEVTWDDQVPQDSEGKYFIGISLRTDSETEARELARRDAQKQVTEQCGGVAIEWADATQTTSAVSGGAVSTTGERTSGTDASGGGVVRGLEARAFCTEVVPTPMMRGAYLAKVAAFLPGGCR